MGKKRIQAIGEGIENQNKKKKTSKKDLLAGKKDIKVGKGQGRLADIGEQALEEAKVIEEKEIELLALKQPMAIDLRFITTGMKINAELERIADLAVNISQRVLEIVNEPLLKPLIDIPKLTEIAQKMVKGSIDAFVKRDEQMAKDVILSDPKANKLKEKIQKELIDDYLIKDGKTATRAIPLLLVARHLERICDHATNIAEDVIYMVRAKVVRHKKLEEKEN